MSARCVMVLGTTSGAGKSWLATALCRWYARQGLKVAPFKAQNMSNNARVVAPTLPALRGSLPPEGALAALGRPGGEVAPTLPAARGSLPPEGALAALGRPGGGEVAPTLPAARGSFFPKGAPAAWKTGAQMGEIGSAQYFQALAARAVPEVRMNPLLLKPERDTASQVVMLGQVDEALSRMPWRARSAAVWPRIAQALDELIAENDVVVIEGAGSPAEINLRESDFVNMRTAQRANARCLLVTDIDRGGAFAHLYGTWALLPDEDRALLAGFVLNKFRGDASLLAPGPQQLQALTGVPTVATLPMWWQHGLPEEDGVFDARPSGGAASTDRTVAVVAYPRISNLDEFQPLQRVPGLRLLWVRDAAQLAGLGPHDWIVLPGSKHTSGDLQWLRTQGLDRAVAAHVAQGGPVLGVCGGLQMLGEALVDPHGIDGNAPGLGLLPLVTVFAREKTVRHRRARFGALQGAWSALSGVEMAGYEIHHGQTAEHPQLRGDGGAVMPEGLAWQNGRGNVLGVYLHGLFEDAAVLRALFGAEVPTLDATFDGLADFIDDHFAPGVLAGLIDAST